MLSGEGRLRGDEPHAALVGGEPRRCRGGPGRNRRAQRGQCQQQGGDEPDAAVRLASARRRAYLRNPEVLVTSLAGHLLVAMPQMQDPRFARTVVYLCAHNQDGAMGLVVNRLLEDVTWPALMKQLGIEAPAALDDRRIHFGGPVEAGRGFVLHSADYVEDGTLVVAGNVALTATLEILRAIGRGAGPKRSLLALGYAGWGPGQLDSEIQANGWLSVAADEDLVFDARQGDKWQRALAKLGIDLLSLSGESGRA
ncbi:MAG TPA: YqgE/AlgH family protein [Stellaceae bacterium]|nr:YqgE/AlgH family protein [Stellaceae bacterium]